MPNNSSYNDLEESLIDPVDVDDDEGGMGLDEADGEGSLETMTLSTKEGKKSEKEEHCSEHLNYMPLWKKPVARQFWVRTEYGFVSTLSLRKVRGSSRQRFRRRKSQELGLLYRTRLSIQLPQY
jgi:hypothetical protein